MNKFTKVKEYFDKGLWNKTMVQDAVIKGWITQNQYSEITGEVYRE